jgi:DNA-binding winged helix-turn-helix (wHTH) protein
LFLERLIFAGEEAACCFILATTHSILSAVHYKRGLEVIPAEPQVFDLLVHLLRNRDRVISKDELIKTVGAGGPWTFR